MAAVSDRKLMKCCISLFSSLLRLRQANIFTPIYYVKLVGKSTSQKKSLPGTCNKFATLSSLMYVIRLPRMHIMSVV